MNAIFLNTPRPSKYISYHKELKQFTGVSEFRGLPAVVVAKCTRPYNIGRLVSAERLHVQGGQAVYKLDSYATVLVKCVLGCLSSTRF